jgi:hypothetical protein
MKKSLLFIALLNFSFVFSQCTISGADQIQVGERQNYTAEIRADYAPNSYQWIYLDQKIIPQSEVDQNFLIAKGSDLGKSMLTLEIKNAKGKIKCQKEITVIAPIANVFQETSNCNDIVSFKEIKISNETVVFEPNSSEGKYTYNWVVSYRSGKKDLSDQKSGKFTYSNQDLIDQVELVIKDGKCSKKITKTYDTNFWYSLEIKNVESKINSQKETTVIAPIPNVLPAASASNCNIDSFKEIKISNETVVFEPNSPEGKYTCNWIVSYRSGKKELSDQKSGKFTYSNQDVIDQVELVIKEGKCSKKITKTYNTNFWYFF